MLRPLHECTTDGIIACLSVIAVRSFNALLCSSSGSEDMVSIHVHFSAGCVCVCADIVLHEDISVPCFAEVVVHLGSPSAL